MPQGKFYVFEGIDGAGMETQSKAFVKLLNDRGIPNLFLDYPEYAKPIGNFIHNYLHSNDQIPVEVKLILFSSDFLKDKNAINQALADGKTVVACRYVTSALAYQVVEGFDSPSALEFTSIMGFPVPDLAFYLKIKPETTKKRKMKEKGNLDRNESNLQLLSKVAARYEEMASKSIFCKWAVIDGEQNIEKVSAAINKILGF